ncbi:MAG: U32 family peptidase [Methanosarcinales archaeon]|nr:MAG: U32 family peptidase [Methanosarcinales archaeon]
MHIPELLAPVGSKESLIAAVENGADAVYFGGALFSARQYASNFDREELEWAIDYAHARGVRTYVTVNTLIKDSELEEACDYLHFLCNCGADAVIVQDIGILKLLREQLPDLPVHASTQMTIHNAEGVKFLQEMGVKRVVLAREMSLHEIKRIKSETGMEIETFIHGALCFSYSGQCLLSSMIGGRSGNRGYCAQPCRKKYRAGDVEGYLLSPKDLNMSEHIPALVEAGIDSFKIEGRMKRPEYVAGVVRVYRRIIDRYVKEPSKFSVTDIEKHTLRQLFNRGFTTGYFFGNPGSELMSRKYPHNRGTEIGKVVDYEPRKKMVSIYLKAQLRAGDGIGIGVRDTGVTVKGIFIGKQMVNTAGQGSTVKVPLEHEVTTGDPVFKTYDSLLMASLEVKSIRKIPVKMTFKAHVDEPLELLISDSINEIDIQGSSASQAESKPISKNAIAEQLKKLGNTIFEACELNVEMDENIFIPVSEINSLRREGIERLMQVRTQKWKRQCVRPMISVGKKIVKPGSPILSVNTGSIETFEAAVEGGADVVYIGDNVFTNGKPQHAIEYGRKKGGKVFFSTSRIIKNIDELSDFFSPQRTQRSQSELAPDGFLAANPGVLFHLKNHNPTMPVVLDYSFNVFNRFSLEYLSNYSNRITLSPELTLKEIKNLTSYGSTECIVHGNFPLMVSEHDLARGLFPIGAGEVCLKDEKGFIFPVNTDLQGRTYIMNSRELCMIEHVPDLINAGVDCLRIEAKTYDWETTGRITRAYRDAIDNFHAKRKCSDLSEHTTGHYFRGVL